MSWASPVSASGPVAPVAAESSWVSDTITLSFLKAMICFLRSWRRTGYARVVGRQLPRSLLAERVKNHLGEPEVEERHESGHDDYEDHAHHRIGDELVPGRPDDLAKLAGH